MASVTCRLFPSDIGPMEWSGGLPAAGQRLGVAVGRPDVVDEHVEGVDARAADGAAYDERRGRRDREVAEAALCARLEAVVEGVRLGVDAVVPRERGGGRLGVAVVAPVLRDHVPPDALEAVD